MLEDGSYDVFVVDARALGPDDLQLDLTILGGPHKGEVVTMRATGLDLTEIDAIGMPGTLTVSGGDPSVVLEG